jgi:arsenate reductase (glutaredoxin)
MITIYHNPRCSKSREGLELLEKTGKEYSVVKYLDTPLTKIEIKDLLQKLGIKPIELVRHKEDIWKEHFADKKLNNTQIISALAKYPQLIERPIIVNGDKAIIARPAEQLNEII